VDRIFAEFAEVLRVGGRVEVGVFGEFEAHVVIADVTTVGDRDFDRLAGVENLLAEDIVFPLVDTYGRGVETVRTELVPFFSWKTRSSARAGPASMASASADAAKTLDLDISIIRLAHNRALISYGAFVSP